MSCVLDFDIREPFFANLTDAPLRDLHETMEFPFFALTKHRRAEPIAYQKDDWSVHIDAPPSYGLPSILDADFLIAVASQINAARELRAKGYPAPAPSPRIQFFPYDILPMIGRPTGGFQYCWLASAIRRLRFVAIRTNVRMRADPTAGMEESFSWLINYQIPTAYGSFMTPETGSAQPDPSRPWEVILHPWVYSAMTNPKMLLAIDPKYFTLGPAERFLYRTARKHAEPPRKREIKPFAIRMALLYARAQALEPQKRFAHRVREIATENRLPQYVVEVSGRGGSGEVTFWRDWDKAPRPRRIVYADGNSDKGSPGLWISCG